MRLPGKTFFERCIIQRLVHFPGSNLPILMPTPNQPIRTINQQTHGRRRVHRLMKRRRVLVTPPHPPAEPTEPAARFVRVLEVPHPHATLLAGPQLGLRARNVS